MIRILECYYKFEGRQYRCHRYGPRRHKAIRAPEKMLAGRQTRLPLYAILSLKEIIRIVHITNLSNNSMFLPFHGYRICSEVEAIEATKRPPRATFAGPIFQFQPFFTNTATPLRSKELDWLEKGLLGGVVGLCGRLAGTTMVHRGVSRDGL